MEKNWIVFIFQRATRFQLATDHRGPSLFLLPFFCPCSSWIPWSNVCVCFSSANPGWYAGTFWLWFPPPLGSLLLIAVCLVFLTLFDSLSLESWATIGDERNDFRVQSFDVCAFGETVPRWQKEEENMGRSLNGVFLLSFHKVATNGEKKLAPTLLEDERPTMMIARQIERKRKRRKFCKLLGSFATSRCRESEKVNGIAKVKYDPSYSSLQRCGYESYCPPSRWCWQIFYDTPDISNP